MEEMERDEVVEVKAEVENPESNCIYILHLYTSVRLFIYSYHIYYR